MVCDRAYKRRGGAIFLAMPIIDWIECYNMQIIGSIELEEDATNKSSNASTKRLHGMGCILHLWRPTETIQKTAGDRINVPELCNMSENYCILASLRLTFSRPGMMIVVR